MNNEVKNDLTKLGKELVVVAAGAIAASYARAGVRKVITMFENNVK